MKGSKTLKKRVYVKNFGIGTKLMKRILSSLKEQGYKQTYLAVQKMNYAVRMYKKAVFTSYMKMKMNIL